MFKQAGGLVLLSMVIALFSSPSFAGENEWKIWLEPIYMNVHGHDQHVLTITEGSGRDFGFRLLTQADPYSLEGENVKTLRQSGFLLLDDILRMPMQLVDEEGNIVGVTNP